jgi:urea ABC transporter urea binding protein
MKKTLAICLTAAMLMLLVSACSSGGSSKEGEIKVGILFSLSGPTSIVEKGMANAALMAIEEINASGGVNGEKLVPIQEDYSSDPAAAATKAQKLIMNDNVIAIVGGLTSASRQAMLPVVEQNNSILIYPTTYEGLEYSKNIIYANSVANQQLEPIVPWLVENVGKRVFFIGNDYVFPVEANNQVRVMLQRLGGEVVGEEYVPIGTTEFSSVLNKIKSAQPDFVFSTLIADSVPAFYNQYHDYGLDSKKIPIASPSATEAEIAGVSPEAAEGNISFFAYFQNLDTPDNQKFVTAYRNKYGNEPIHTMMEASYNAVYLLKMALEKAGSDRSTENILNSFIGLELQAPQGKIKVAENNHLWVIPRIAKLNAEGQFEIVKEFDEPIEPQPWSELLYPDHEKPWEK